MNYHRHSRIEARFSGICLGDPGVGDGGTSPGGGEGGGGGSGPSSDSGGSPGPASSPSGYGGAHAEDADHKFPVQPPPSATEADRISKLLKLGDDEPIGMEDIRALMGFNPPLKQPTEQKPEAKPAEAKTATPATPAQTEPPKTEQAPLSPDAKAIVDALTKATEPQAKPEQPGQPAAPKKFYGDVKPAMQVAPQVMADIFQAEDPAKAGQALNFLIGGVMETIMQDVLAVQQAMVRNLMTQIPQVVTQQADSRSNAEKFYSKYPELNKGPLHTTAQFFAKQLADKRAAANQPVWDDTFLTELGETVHSYVEQQLGVKIQRAGAPAVANAPVRPAAPQTPQSTAPKPNGSAGQPWMSPGSSRPPAGSGSDKSADLRNLVL